MHLYKYIGKKLCRYHNVKDKILINMISNGDNI